MAQAVTRPKAQGYGVLLGDDYFRVAPSDVQPIVVYTQDSLAKRQDDQGLAGENVLELGYAFGRQNLTGGEGLDWWPRPAGEPNREIDPIRFWDSANVDIRRPESGQAYSTKLVKQIASWSTPASDPTDMGASRDAVYMIEGTNIHRFDDWTDTTPEDTDDIGETLTQLEVGLDDTVLVVDDQGDIWMKPDNSEAYVQVYDNSTDGGEIQAAWWVKGRIIAMRKDNTAAGTGEVVEIDPGIGGTPATPTSSNTVGTIDTFNGQINDVVDAGHAIVAAFSDGSLRSYVPQTDTAGNTPLLTVRARGNAPKQENPIELGWNLGQLLVFTLDEAPTGGNKVLRLYTASVLDSRFDYAVGNLQLIRVWQGTNQDAPAYDQRIVTSRDEAFFAVAEGASNWNIWRYDFVTQGVFRHAKVEAGEIKGLTYFDDRLAYCDGADTYLQSDDTYAAEGYLITPNITFGLNTPISWSAFVLEMLNLTSAGVRIDFYRTTNPEAILDPDHDAWVLIQSYTDPSQSGVELAAVNVEANQLALMVKLYPSDSGTVSPDLKRFAVRGLPQHRDWVVEVPINVSDIISAPGRMPLRVPGRGDTVHGSLLDLQGKATTLEVYGPQLTMRGMVEGFMQPVTYVGNRGSVGRYMVVRFLGKLVGTTTTTAVSGNAGMGIAQAGVATMGIGEV